MVVGVVRGSASAADAFGPAQCARPPEGGAANGEWRTYGADLASTRYAPLDQINKDNFNKLEVAWRFKTDTSGRGRSSTSSRRR